MKKTRIGLFLAVFSVAACAGSFRTVGMHDQVIDVVQALAQTQAATIKSLTEALSRAAALSCPVPKEVSDVR